MLKLQKNEMNDVYIFFRDSWRTTAYLASVQSFKRKL